MSGPTLKQLVRDQILAEGPDIASTRDQWTHQEQYNRACYDYVDGELNAMTNVELLERISDALHQPAPCTHHMHRADPDKVRGKFCPACYMVMS
jgi:hypothetical protein